MRDPRDAAYAIVQARWVLELERGLPGRRWIIAHLALVLFFLVVLHAPEEAAVVALPLVFIVVARMVARRQVERARRSLRLNEQLAQAFEIPVPEPPVRAPEPVTSGVPPIWSKSGALSILAAVLIAAFLVATSIGTRTTVTRDRSKSPWALNADDACARIAAGYRALDASSGPLPFPGDRPLVEIAAIRRQRLVVQQNAATMMRSWGQAPPPGAPARALAAFEQKIDLEWEAVRAADRGDRAAYEQAMARMIGPTWEARHAFAAARAPVCARVV